jgi:phosphoglycolate phosphatase-like HAD superfamily hydrolase
MFEVRFVRVLVSDLDGTLLDQQERTIQAHITALQRAGYDIESERIRSFYRLALDSKELLESLNIRLPRHELSQYITNLQDAFYSGWKYTRIIPGIFEALADLRQRIQVMQLITSRWHTEETRSEVRKFGLDRFFDGLFTRSDLARDEGVEQIPLFPFVPHRQRLIRLAIRGINHKGDVWIVGDTSGELEAAINLRFVTVGVLTGISSREDLAPFATHIINSFPEIVQLI